LLVPLIKCRIVHHFGRAGGGGGGGVGGGSAITERTTR
jgi:hypothetical protein